MSKFKVGFTDKRGYKFVWCPDHPFVRKDGYMQEHRMVMELHLERYLYLQERVHHINGNKGDNRIKNLKLFPSESKHQSDTPHKCGRFIYKYRIKKYMREYMRERMRRLRKTKPKNYRRSKYDKIQSGG